MFAHVQTAGSTVLDFPDVPFTWDRSATTQPLTVFTDENIEEAVAHASPRKVAWLFESPEVTRKSYRSVHRNPDQFDRILTFSQPLLETLPNARFTPIGGSWLHAHDWKIHEKTRNISIIASKKRSLSGQKLRHTVIEDHRNSIDFIAGHGYQPIDLKIEALKDFRYSLCIENCRQNFYFSEKLIDCFLSGTVPIYWGCPAIGLFFNLDGMVTFENHRQLKATLPMLNEADYRRRSAAIKMNFELAQRYVYVEKFIWKNIASLTT